ncbi:short-chain dehydrogenase [Chlorella sorokiniana]|uniref:Short-chain dehydrogenase n=1 Tax=Chlorella sorokiniana TaxID=3076 RepID=A0A2P6TWX3_CHLSO|nr:short-chain dehydrogenase [Chlorella sorokiniana]|eukprot:PRW58565.1 short-chain dehydrogenase [Chlorella sorokiniana]
MRAAKWGNLGRGGMSPKQAMEEALSQLGGLFGMLSAELAPAPAPAGAAAAAEEAPAGQRGKQPRGAQPAGQPPAEVELMGRARTGKNSRQAAAALEVGGVALPRRQGDPNHISLMMFVEKGSLQAIQDDAAAAASWQAAISCQGLRGSKGQVPVKAKKAALLGQLQVSTTVLP